jgi:hypothetical protein
MKPPKSSAFERNRVPDARSSTSFRSTDLQSVGLPVVPTAVRNTGRDDRPPTDYKSAFRASAPILPQSAARNRRIRIHSLPSLPG